MGSPLLPPLLWPSPAPPPCPGGSPLAWPPLSVPTPPALAWQIAGPGHTAPWLTQGWPHGGPTYLSERKPGVGVVGTSLRPLVLSRLRPGCAWRGRFLPLPAPQSREVLAKSVLRVCMMPTSTWFRMVQEAFRGRATQGSDMNMHLASPSSSDSWHPTAGTVQSLREGFSFNW